MLGSLSRLANRAGLPPTILKKREALARRIPVVVGAATLRNFSFVRLDFPKRQLTLASTRTYQPPSPGSVVAALPLLDWRGRPAFQARLNGESLTFVLDTAGEFGVILPGATAASGTLTLSAGLSESCAINTPEEKNLPPTFPARVGLEVLAKYVVTLDYKTQRIWFENPALQAAAQTVDSSANPSPIHYRGVHP